MNYHSSIIPVARFRDEDPTDPYECITIGEGATMVDLTHEQAMLLALDLLSAVLTGRRCDMVAIN
ncbi:hypothetical protein [Corynebacterium sp. TAE3-ERU16]|uniref:hypothetical protein n=1 Tax=Corynebacterium sp. TAE3-ERU16 TaxID=2849493 RepID=UPI001C46A958|nr:hypothetical protein [Corynebacterium sp. TAE3-ERU16]MBV7292376.1 hypothetical protein [Corynebacterium sp. TAE3-ERU16]